VSRTNPAPERVTDEQQIARHMVRMHRYTSEKSNRGELLEGESADAVAMLTSHQLTICTAATCAGKDCPNKRGAAFSFAEHRQGTTRGSANVLRIHAAVFDIDHATPEQARGLLARLKASGLACVLSSTHSHRPGAPRLRLVIFLNRPALAAEWPALWHAINAGLELNADSSAQDPARLYFMPTSPADVKPIAWSQPGQPLDVDLFLIDAPAAPPARKAPLSGVEWLGQLERLGEGNRDNGLTRLAGLLIRALPPELAEQLIHSVNATHCRPPLDEAQVNKIVSSVARREAERLQGAR